MFMQKEKYKNESALLQYFFHKFTSISNLHDLFYVHLPYDFFTFKDK